MFQKLSICSPVVICAHGKRAPMDLPVRNVLNTYVRSMSLNKPFINPNLNIKSSGTSAAPLSSKATARQDLRKNYIRDGYVVMKNLFTPAEIGQLSDDIVAIARGRYGEFQGRIAIDGQLKDNEVVAKYSRITFPHKISPNLLDLALAHPKVVDVLTSLIGPNVKAMSSKVYVDGPGERGRVWHQDEGLIPTRDRSLICAIIAVDDHTVENGCPLMHPGSHKSGVQFRLRNPGHIELLEEVASISNTHSSQLETAQSDADIEAYDVSRDPNAGVPIELPAGSVVFVNGYTLQRMLPNTSSYVLRRAMKIHYCSAESLLPWNMDGQVPFGPDNRDIVMVAGKDPYEYKGIANLAIPHAVPKKASE